MLLSIFLPPLVWELFEKSQCLSTAWIFPLYFQLTYLPEETCFQQAGSSVFEGTSQAVLGSSDQRKVAASLSLFLKSEKIPALLYVGKGHEYKPFLDFRPVPSAYRPRTQISNHRRACTQALLYETPLSFLFPFFSVISSGYQGFKNFFNGTRWNQGITGYQRKNVGGWSLCTV
jgi:hypothetical protein